jgi:protein gp37
MNKTNIDWPGLTHTWNPCVGCPRGCSYCYAEKMHNKRHKAFKRGKLQNVKQYAKPFEEIQFFPKRLLGPGKKRKPCKIFVGSMSDVCYWERDWVIQVIGVCEVFYEHTFMFLTKSPAVYSKFDFPENCMLGITITGLGHYKNISVLKHVSNKTFLSVEPLLGNIGEIPDWIDLVIVGAMTGKNAIVPHKEWIESIKHHNIYYKNNIRRCL